VNSLAINLKVNIFATIKTAQSFNKVTYYTVKFENEEYSEFEKFIIGHRNLSEIHNEYNDLMSLIKRLGNEIGALERYFSRKERKAEALPPEWNKLRPHERKLHIKYHHNLRLYCMRINDEVVFLFNGGIKTPGRITAQECKVVRQYFRMANKLASCIEEAMKDGEISFHGKRIEIEEDYELIL